MIALSFTIDVWEALWWLGKGLLWMALGGVIVFAFIVHAFSGPFFRLWAITAAMLLASPSFAADRAELQAVIDTHKTLTVSGRNNVDAPLVLPRVDGGRILFDGGIQTCLHFDWEYREPTGSLGNASALIWKGKPNEGPIVEIKGAGFGFDGGINLIGYSQAVGPWKAIDHSKDLCSLGVLFRGTGGETGTAYGLDNGATRFSHMFIGGCRRGIQFGVSREENNADNNQFEYIACSHVDNLICFKNMQTVSNTFRHIRQHADGTPAEQRAFELLRFEAGGKCVVKHAEINAGLVCRAIGSDWNTGFLTLDVLSTDPAGGDSFRLFDGAPAPGRAPCPFIFTVGEIQNGMIARESPKTAGYFIDAYAGQRVNINGGGLLEARNGPLARLRGSKTQRAVCFIRGVTFDSVAATAPKAILSADSDNYLLRLVDCLDREGNIITKTFKDKLQ